MGLLKSAFIRVLSRYGYDLVRPDAARPDLEPEFLALYAEFRDYTMTSVERMYALYQAMRYVVDGRVPGDIVECGVWRGGSAMLCARILEQAGERGRRIHLYDTFAGMTEPSDTDVGRDGIRARDIWRERGGWADGSDWCNASLQEVRGNMLRTGISPDQLVFVEGKVEDTLPGTIPDRIALLRLDTDWYKSTFWEMEHLYPRLVPGGVLIVDDYGSWRGSREAIDGYLGKTGDQLLLLRIDSSGRIGVKP